MWSSVVHAFLYYRDLLCNFILTTICYYHYYLKKWHQPFSESQSYNQLQKYLRHCTVFWHKWPVHDLVLVISPPPLIKVASNTRPCSKLGGTTFNGREEGGQYYISQTCDQQRFEARKVVFSWECLNIFVTGCSWCLRKERRTEKKNKTSLYRPANYFQAPAK